MTPLSADPLQAARAFLSLRRIALAGASRDAGHFSRALLRELVRRGYDVVPVNPGATEIEGLGCHARIGDVTPPPEGVLVLTPVARTDAVVADALAAGVRHVWLHRGGGAGSATADARAACEARGVRPVTDLCPLMALPGAAWPHRLHGWIRARGLRRCECPAAT
ncbi:MAG: CoA-binding protein [Anaeromyxobacteraceae bacterium]